MQANNIDEIIRLVLTREASREETAILKNWLAESAENQQVFFQLQRIWDTRDPEPPLPDAGQISEQIWVKALQNENDSFPIHKIRKPFSFSYYLKTAAIVLLVTGLSWLLFFYQPVQRSAKLEAVRIEKKTAIGQKLKITLPDGSLAWLNADSKIQYAEHFEGNTRTVALDGEGFFEVAKNPHKPFIVKSGKLSTTAIGTSFNVSAYTEDSTIQVALITGKVQVKSDQAGYAGDVFHLNKGEGIDFNKRINRPGKYQFDPQMVIAWKQGILIFEGDSFEEVKSKLRRWYGVEVTISGIPPDDWKLTGKFKNEALPSVLENIRFGRNFSYKIAGKKLYLLFETPKS